MADQFIASLDTSVPVSRTIAQIQGLVERFRAREFRTIYGPEGDVVAVRFTIIDPHLTQGAGDGVFTVELHAVSDAIDAAIRRGRKNRITPTQSAAFLAQAKRVAWRHLHDVIRASLIAVQSGILTIGEAFLCNLVVTATDGREQRLGEMMFERRLLAPSNGKLMIGGGNAH